MAKEPTYPVGAKVRIKDPGKRPENWNDQMTSLIGEIGYVRVNNSDNRFNNADLGRYRYKLFGGNRSWLRWRHCDLELLEMPRLDPNVAFRNRNSHAII